MIAITVLRENVPTGPFNRAEVAEKLQSGEFSPESLAFIEGLTQWTPLREVLARVDAPPSSIGTPAATPMAFYSYAATMQPPSHLAYAGFWLRFAASFVDGLIFSPFLIVLVVLIARASQNDDVQGIIAIFSLFYVFFWIAMRWLYFALQEAGVHQATIGKRLFGLRVTDVQGNRIGFGRATGRFFGKILSSFVFHLGYLMAGWTPRKQALHDMLADTLVVKR